jgi:CRP-like cAMP-binding protein
MTNDLPGNVLLGRLPAEEAAGLLPRLRRVELSSGEVLFDANTPAPFAYFPVGAVLSLELTTAGRSGIEVGAAGKEGVAGVLTALRIAPETTRCAVRVPGAAYRIPSEAISTAAQAGTVLQELLLRYLSAFLFQLGQRAACNSLHTATHRCCRWLLWTCDQADCDALPLTQTGVSKLMGLRRPTVTEVFQSLALRGLIRYQRRLVEIVDRPGLELDSCACYRAIREQYDRPLS